MDIAERLKWARSLTGMSQRRLAEAAGLKSEGPVRHLESGITKSVETKTAVALSAALGCSVGWLLTGEEPAPTEEHLRSLRPVAPAEPESSEDKDVA